MSAPLILASASPRRRELLAQLGLTFQVEPADVDERPHPHEAPGAYVARIARDKACTLARRHPGALVLAADTTVVLAGQVLGKPEDEADARRMLGALAGRAHQVLTAVALEGPHSALHVEQTQVHMRQASAEELAWYVSTGEPRDKAGAYAIQGRGGFLVERIEGSYSNVVGLPLAQTVRMLCEAGFALPWSAA
jgi:septum formation protein